LSRRIEQLTHLQGQIGITDSNTQLVINGCLTIFNFVVAGGMAFTVDRFGRRPLFLSATFGMVGVSSPFTLITNLSELMPL
jgi:hypothetical protein